MVDIRSYLIVVPLLTILVLHAGIEDLTTEFLSIYKELVELSRLGVDVDELVKELAVVLDLMSNGSSESVARAEYILRDIRARLEVLRSKASYDVLYASLVRYSAITLLAMLPVITYYLLPRAYLRVWFRVRKRWVVRYGRTR